MATIFVVSIFLTGCNLVQRDEAADRNPYLNEELRGEAGFEEDAFPARKNLDLHAIGALLQEADNAQELEYLLNSEGVNNLDFNDDGYVDYISVREFDDRYDDERGFSLFSQFGPEEILEIATIIFDREGYNYPGARVLLTGNRDLYGNNNFYEANWLERSLEIVDWLFSDRDEIYRSPYYVDHYPDYYEAHPVVEPPVYRARIVEYYSEPVFVQTASPSITEIKIQSPYKNKSVTKIYSKPAKWKKDKKAFEKNDPGVPEFVKAKKDKEKNAFFKSENKIKGNPKDFEDSHKIKKVKHEMRVKPDKIRKEKEKPSKPIKMEKQNMPSVKIEKQKVPPGWSQNQSMKPPKPVKEGKQNHGKGAGKGNGKRGKP